jgi:hypothetical protein
MDFTVAPQTGRSAVWYAFFIGYYAAIYNTLHTLQAPQQCTGSHHQECKISSGIQ